MAIVLTILFLLLSALFSGSEIAFVSGNKLRVELRKKRGGTRGTILSNFYEKPAAFLGVMLVGNNIALVAFTTLMDSQFLGPLLSPGIPGEILLLLVNTTIITIIVLIFGEYLPKTLFRLYGDEALYLLAYPIRLLQIILGIPAYIMTKSATGILWLFVRQELNVTEDTFTRLDLEKLVEESRSNETEEEIDRELFGKALNLQGVRVRECMIPRPEMETIEVTASVDELEVLFMETKLSRIVVYDTEVDNVLGYVHHQQLLDKPRSIRSLIMKLPFVPEAMRVTDLLNRFIRDGVNISIVVDEFGGVAGLITLEDVLEEIFGEIEDEHDEEELQELFLGDDEWLFSGRLEIDLLNEKYGLTFPDGDYHTLSGYLVMTGGQIPEQGARIEQDGYAFILEQVSDTKIETVRVKKLPDPEIA